VVGVYDNSPTVFTDIDGQAKGLFIDLLEVIADKEGWALEYKSGHFGVLLDDLKAGRIDLLPAVAYSHGREQFLDYAFETVMSNWAELYIKAPTSLGSLLDLEGKIVAVKAGDIHFKALQKMAENFNLKNTRFFEADEYSTVFEMVQYDYVDVAVVNRLFGNRNKKVHGLQATQVIFNPIEMRFAVPKGKNLEVLGALDRHLIAFKQDTQSEYYKSINRWFVVDTKENVPQWVINSLYAFFALSLFLGFIVVLFKRQVKNRTLLLQNTNIELSEEIKTREKAEEKLRRFARVVEASSDGMALLDRGNHHILANKTYLQMFGKEDDSIEGKELTELVGDSFFELELHRAVAECLLGQVVHVHTRPRQGHSNDQYWNVTLSPYHADNGLIDGYVIDVRDVTEQVELQNRLKNSQKMEAIGMLAGGVAHDLNNILSGLVSYPDMLLVGRDDDDPMRKPLETIKKSGERAAAIVQDLLTLARRGIGQTIPQNLNLIVQEFLASPEHDDIVCDFGGIEIVTALAPELKNTRGSAPHLSKILMNLFTNALEAMSGGGILRIETSNEILITERTGYESIPAGDYVKLMVSDTGVGMSTVELNRIFEPFYTKKVLGRSGTGLGMAVVWGSIKDHHGYIDIDSAPGVGTVFTLYFPSTPDEITQVEAEFHQFLGRGERILVVDDLRDQRTLVEKILQKLDYSVDLAESGEQAVEKCRKQPYDLLILDMIMPGGMDGLSTYETITSFNPQQKAIIASGFSESSRVREAQHKGAGEYIRKPYTVETLARAIKEELQNEK
jgi:PAS domain S-box-containing protein